MLSTMEQSAGVGGGFLPSKLFIGGLSYDTTDASLAHYFSQYGVVASATVLRDPVTSHSRGFGFVTFTQEDAAKRVLAHSRNHIVDGRKVEAKIAVPRSQTAPGANPMTAMGMQGGFPQPYGRQNMGMPMNMGMPGIGLGDPTFMLMPGGYPDFQGSHAQQQYYQMQEQLGMGMNNMNSQNHYNTTTGIMSSEGVGLSLSAKGFAYGDSTGYNDTQEQKRLSISRGKLDEDVMRYDILGTGSANTSGTGLDEHEDMGTNKMIGSPSNRRPTFSPGTSNPVLNVSPSHLRKLSMPQSKLQFNHADELDYLTNSLAGVNVGESDLLTGPRGRKVFVSNIGMKTSEASLKNLFQNFGQLDDVHVDNTKGMGFIVFSSPKSAQNVLNFQETSGNFRLDGEELKVHMPGFGDPSPTSVTNTNKGLRRGTEVPGFKSHDLADEGYELQPGGFPLMRANSAITGMLPYQDEVYRSKPKTGRVSFHEKLHEIHEPELHDFGDEYVEAEEDPNFSKMRSLSINYVDPTFKSSPYFKHPEGLTRRSSSFASSKGFDEYLAEKEHQQLRTRNFGLGSVNEQ